MPLKVRYPDGTWRDATAVRIRNADGTWRLASTIRRRQADGTWAVVWTSAVSISPVTSVRYGTRGQQFSETFQAIGATGGTWALVNASPGFTLTPNGTSCTVTSSTTTGSGTVTRTATLQFTPNDGRPAATAYIEWSWEGSGSPA